MTDPYRPPVARVEDAFVKRDYGGLDRGTYAAIFFLLAFVFAVARSGMVGATAFSSYAPLVLFVLLAIASAYRLANIGSSGLLSLLLLIPIVNFALVFRCLAFPEGYSDNRKLDLAGKAMVAFLTVCVSMLIGAVALEVMHAGSGY